MANAGTWTTAMGAGTLKTGSHTLSVSLTFNAAMQARTYGAYFTWMGLEACGPQNIGAGDAGVTALAAMTYALRPSSPGTGGAAASSGTANRSTSEPTTPAASTSACTSPSPSPDPDPNTVEASSQPTHTTSSGKAAQPPRTQQASSARSTSTTTWFTLGAGLVLLLGAGGRARLVRRRRILGREPQPETNLNSGETPDNPQP